MSRKSKIMGRGPCSVYSVVVCTVGVVCVLLPGSAVGDGGNGTFSVRQAKDYSVGASGGGGGSGGGYTTGPVYGSPMSNYGSYPPAHYAIAPIVMSHQGAGGGMGMGWYDDSGSGGGDDYKELIGLLGLKGLKGIKAVKAVKAIKAIGLLPLLPLAPLLAPLLLLLPLLLLIPLLLPLALLLFLPIPVVTTPNGGRRRRDTGSSGHKTLMQETLEEIASRVPASVMTMNPKEVHSCMDKFICDTGVFVSRHAPGFVTPAAWLLSSIWPAELQPKVETFRRVATLPKSKQYNICNTQFKCRVKKLEHLFHGLVYEYSGKLRTKISNRLKPGEPVSPASVLAALFT